MADAPAHPGLGALVQPLPAHKQHQHPGQQPQAALPGRMADYDGELASKRGRKAIAERLEEFRDDPQMALEFYKNKTLSQ